MNEQLIDLLFNILEGIKNNNATPVEELANDTNLGIRVQHTTGANAVSLSVLGQDFTNANVAIGYNMYNDTDDSSTVVTSAVGVSVVGVLSGGTDNDWDVNDYANVPEVVRYGIDMSQHSYLTLHYKLVAGTSTNRMYMKIYGTLKDSANLNDDTDWVNLSSDLLGNANGINVSNGTLEDMLILDTKINIAKYMVKVVSENSVGVFANSHSIYVKKSN